MKYFIGLLAFLTLQASPPLNLYQIDAAIRGTDFLVEATAAFTASGTIGTTIPNTSEVAIQTHAIPRYFYPPGIINGMIPYVQNQILAAPNKTLFIIPFNNGIQGLVNGLTALTQYLAVGIEQIVTIAYRYRTNNSFPPIGFISNYPSNVLPLFQIDPAKRAADVKAIVTTLINGNSGTTGVTPAATPILNFTGSAQVWILTTLQGPFYIPFATNIVPNAIPNVTAVSVVSGGLLQITYSPLFPASPQTVITPLPTVFVAVEQVEQIIYFPDVNKISTFRQFGLEQSQSQQQSFWQQQ